MFKRSITVEEINNLPLIEFNGKIHLIRNDDEVLDAIDILQVQTHLGFDTESKPSFTKGKKNNISVIQIATENEAFVFQLKNISNFDPIFSIFTNPKITKIGLAINNDLSELRRLQNFKEQNFIDLQKYVKKFNIDDLSLKKITAIVLNKKISKRQQRSNWAAKELTWAQINYAAIDAWACLLIYNNLKEFEDKIIE